MTLVLDNQDVLAAADMKAVINELEAAMTVEARGGVESVPRINFKAGEGMFFRVMPAASSDLDLLGLKAFNSSSDGKVRYLVCLWSAASGELVALLDASHLTGIRTGAMTGVAQRAMAGPELGQEVGVIGSGLEARTNLEAICAVTDVRRVKVYSPNGGRRAAYASEMAERLGIEVVTVAEAAEAADCPTVLTATNTGIGSGVLALEAGWLRPGCHVNTIGSTMATLREADAAIFARADTVVLDTLDAVAESGDLIEAVERHGWDQTEARSLADFVAAVDGERNEGDRLTVFKSVGTALQDLIAAKAIYDVARQRGLGREIDFLSVRQFEGLPTREPSPQVSS